MTQGGPGGYSIGTLTLTAKTTLYIYSGGQPTAVKVGGFNGGGTGYSSGYGGGGASDIRIAEDSLYARVIVAGGGGGPYNGSSFLGASKRKKGNGENTNETSIVGSNRSGGGGTQTQGG